MSSKILKMSFDPNTIEHLGVRMYSTLPPVLAELIANSYDADARNVTLTLSDCGLDKEITIEDDGVGMSFTEINDKFLRIGRNRRYDESQVTNSGRKVIGKKGLGKLSFFGITHEIEVTTRKNGMKNIFSMKWEDIKNTTSRDYTPIMLITDEPCSETEHGTKIVLKKIQRQSPFKPFDLANNLARIFIIDANFSIKIIHNNESPVNVENDRKFDGLDKEIEWNFSEIVKSFENNYDKSSLISGCLITTKKPIPPSSNMRGIILFSRKKLVNRAEYFSESTSSHFYSYLTGWLEVDFIDELSDDVISTDRQSLNWNHEEMKKLRDYLKNFISFLEKDWRERRKELRKTNISSSTGVNIESWLSKVPQDIKEKIVPILDDIIGRSELPTEANKETVKRIYNLVPEYPHYHWRHLHSRVQTTSRSYYENKDYYTAFFEAVKVYINAVKLKVNSNLTDRELLENTFAISKPRLSVTKKFKKSDGTSFEENTIKNITEGHKMLVIGIWTACRCPIAHEEVNELRESGLFTEENCLDALSLLSHLFYRLDNSEVP